MPPPAPAQPDPPTATRIPNAEPTSIVPDGIRVQQYVHPSNRFSINRPDNWLTVDRPDGVLFLEPGDEGGYSVFFADVGQPYKPSQLRDYLLVFLVKNLVSDPDNFTLLSENQLTDGTVLIQFKSDDTQLGQAINELRAYQEDTIIYLLLISTSEVQWPLSQQKLQPLINSFLPLDTAPEVTPTPPPPVWDVIGPNSIRLAFTYPSDWEVLAQSEKSVMVRMPDTEIVFSASHFSWSPTDPTAAESAVRLYLQALQDSYGEVKHQPMTEHPLADLSGVTLDFVYADSDKQLMQGSIIAAAQNGTVYQIVFTAPAKYYESSLNWFNPMYKSLRILPADELIIPE